MWLRTIESETNIAMHRPPQIHYQTTREQSIGTYNEQHHVARRQSIYHGVMHYYTAS